MQLTRECLKNGIQIFLTAMCLLSLLCYTIREYPFSPLNKIQIPSYRNMKKFKTQIWNSQGYKTQEVTYLTLRNTVRK